MVWFEAMDYTRRVPFTPNWTEIVQASTEELQNRFQAMSRKPEASGLRLFARKRPVKKKSAPREERGAGEKVCRQRATLPPGFPGSTITAEGLNFRVRNGNGWVPLAMVTGNGEKVFTLCRCEGTLTAAQRGVGVDRLWRRGIGQALDRLVPVS